MTGDLSAGYIQYIQSPEWAAKRRQALDYFGEECARCGANWRLEVHHRTYARFRNERLGDLEVLCPDCHAIADIERKAARRTERDEPLMQSWADTTFGPFWSDETPWLEMLQRFRSARAEAFNAILNGKGAALRPDDVRHFGEPLRTWAARSVTTDPPHDLAA